MAIDLDEALNVLAAKFCGECGVPLTPAGTQCGQCGALPEQTRAELAETLAEPGRLAQVEAYQLRENAARYREQWETSLREADAVLHLAALENARDGAQGVLEAALGARKQALARLRETEAAEEVAQGPFSEAYERLQKAERDEEAARRERKGPDAEGQAAIEVIGRRQVCDRYQGPFLEAGTVRQAAETALAAAEAEAERAERVRDAHIAAVEDPGRAPMSPETMRALNGPVVEMAERKRIKRPDGHWTPAEVMADDELVFIIGTADLLSLWTGLSAAYWNKGNQAGHEDAEAKTKGRPVVHDSTAYAPGAKAIPGGIYSPGTPPR